ncbi:unnamed protein product [Rhizophagus irregularis]|uniref:Uncharacterized protein n=1 Tax=Rhizophagus irregularis TaxID=588596 RepID=A0A2N1NGC7_9GLOM|nr:hypothetical protein RhiirC2_776628 [Rhizophagus irregularis]CAB4380933.1 unnamed protein product [Rhizophagus irregularis]CAB5347755.1 unnamed protein product [Rhizophagus irregularis]
MVWSVLKSFALITSSLLKNDYGMLFLDCYGRIFDWDHINFLLWSLGNYFENRLDEPKDVAWGVGNGTITEFEVDPQDKHLITQ